LKLDTQDASSNVRCPSLLETASRLVFFFYIDIDESLEQYVAEIRAVKESKNALNDEYIQENKTEDREVSLTPFD